mmetsp:Transcript_44004/g.82227  ORF Transcript_44004/g.82227 Transcript_44004/m.82227 type:complete len:568 (+) Transcript_44004:69-1772(+)
MYGTFRGERERTNSEVDRHRRKEAGDEDEFPWFVAALFLLILGAYAVVMYGCWDTAQRMEVLGTRSEKVLMLTANVSEAMGGVLTASAQEADEAIHKNLDWLLLESDSAIAEARMLANTLSDASVTLNISAQEKYAKLVTLVYAESRRLGNLTAGLHYVAQPAAAHDFARSVDALLGTLQPLTSALPRYDKEVLESLMNSSQDIQRSFSEIDLSVQSMQDFLEGLHVDCEAFIQAAGLLANHTMVHDIEGRLVALQNESDAVNGTRLVESEYFHHLVSLNLVREHASLSAEDQAAVLEAVRTMADSAQRLAKSVRASKDGIVKDTTAVVKAVAAQAQDQFSALALHSMLLSTEAKENLEYAASMYLRGAGACVGTAVVMAFLALAYACYLEYIYENEGIARVYDIAAKDRSGCAWCCVGFVGYWVNAAGFTLLVLLQDFVSIMLVVVALFMCLVGDLHLGLEFGCGFAPVLADDQTCTETMQNFSTTVQRDLLGGKGCSDAGVLMCEDVVGNSGLVRATMVAAGVGALASCCVPRRLIALSLSAQQSIQTAEAIVAWKQKVHEAEKV